MDNYVEGDEDVNSEDCFDEDDFDEFADLAGYGNREAADFMINIPIISIINSNYQQLKNNKEVSKFMLE